MSGSVRDQTDVVSVKGVTVWFTGLPSSGKSTIARIVERQFRKWSLKVELLDGDVIRTNLSKGLGFSREDRGTNIKRVGFICQLLSRNGVIAIASVISPYREARDYNRRLIGNFVEVFVRASIEECEKRDVKGLYKKAKAGEIQEFTGVNDPYEEPLNAEVICDTEDESAEQSAEKVIRRLNELGYIAFNGSKAGRGTPC
ncbi:MAG: adenylyl-sulfate kinase [Candidatus Omnitrophota bacterium]|nr:adenylyl-sulfate kinase [Candidatus Omnitrophota bacterium]